MAAIITLTPKFEDFIISVYLSRNISNCYPTQNLPKKTSPISAYLNFTHPSLVQKCGPIRTSGKSSLITGGPQQSPSPRPLTYRAPNQLYKVILIILYGWKKPNTMKGYLFPLDPSGIQSAINERGKERCIFLNTDSIAFIPRLYRAYNWTFMSIRKRTRKYFLYSLKKLSNSSTGYLQFPLRDYHHHNQVSHSSVLTASQSNLFKIQNQLPYMGRTKGKIPGDNF